MKKTLMITASLSLLGLCIFALINQNKCLKEEIKDKRKHRRNKALAKGNFAHIEEEHQHKKPFRNTNRDAANRK